MIKVVAQSPPKVLGSPPKFCVCPFLEKLLSCVDLPKNFLVCGSLWKNSAFMFWSLKKFSCACPLWKKFLSLCQRKIKIPFFLFPLFSSYLYGSPLPWNIFISLLELRVDMGSLYMCGSLGDFPKDAAVSCLVSDQILSMLTFLSKNQKESLLQPTICVLCTKWPLPSYG